MRLRTPLVTLVAVATLLTGCGAGSPADTRSDHEPEHHGASGGHGHVDGAQEVSEPQLALVSLDSGGRVGLLDLLTGESDRLGELPALVRGRTVTSDGRYVFAPTEDGVAVLDSGRWTWEHGDHSHYYRADPVTLGVVPGSGPARVATGPVATAGGTAVVFEGSGEAVLLDNAALADGEVSELFRIDVGAGAVLAPAGDSALLADDGHVARLDASGQPVGKAGQACREPAGTISTSVGVVLGCADGAVLATDDGGLEKIEYPTGSTAPAVTGFHARKGRPTVAGIAGDGSHGLWLLDTRERRWQHLDVPGTVVRAVAVDDADQRVLALDRAGRLHVLGARRGDELAVTEPLVDDPTQPGVSLTVDRQRAYLNDPVAGVVYEIDYADDARVARRITTPTDPHHLAEVGR